MNLEKKVFCFTYVALMSVFSLVYTMEREKTPYEAEQIKNRLRVAAKHGGSGDISDAIENHEVEINDEIEPGRNLLMIALEHNQYELANWLIEQGARFPTRATAKRKQSDEEEKEIEGEREQKKPRTGLSPQEVEEATKRLLIAAEHGDIDEAESALDAGADINLSVYAGDLAITDAANNNQTAMVEWLAERGAALDVKDGRGNTLLTIAINSNNLNLARFLLEQGIPILLTDVTAAMSSQSARLIKLLMIFGVRMSPCSVGQLRFSQLMPSLGMQNWLMLYGALHVDWHLISEFSPLLQLLRTGNAEDYLAQLTERAKTDEGLTVEEKQSLNDALIEAASIGNADVLKIILGDFKHVLMLDHITEAFWGAIMNNQLSTLQALIDSTITDSSIVPRQMLVQTLQEMLLLAIAQGHKDIATYILNLNRENSAQSRSSCGS